MKFSRRDLFDIDVVTDENYLVTGAPEEYKFDPADLDKVNQWLDEVVIEAENLADAREEFVDAEFPQFLKRKWR